jgi:hypothetical protein
MTSRYNIFISTTTGNKATNFSATIMGRNTLDQLKSGLFLYPPASEEEIEEVTRSYKKSRDNFITDLQILAKIIMVLPLSIYLISLAGVTPEIKMTCLFFLGIVTIYGFFNTLLALWINRKQIQFKAMFLSLHQIELKENRFLSKILQRRN